MNRLYYLFLFVLPLYCVSTSSKEDAILVSRVCPANCENLGNFSTSGYNYKNAMISIKKTAVRKNANFIMINSESTTIMGQTQIDVVIFRCANIDNQLSMLRKKALTQIDKKSSTDRIRLAVMLFKANQGITKNEALYITERIRTGLISKGNYDVVTNDQIKTMVTMASMKQIFEKESCTSCEIDIGKALKCDAMIVGSVSMAFNEYSISMRLLDVEKQKYVFALDQQVKDRKDISSAIDEIVDKLAR